MKNDIQKINFLLSIFILIHPIISLICNFIDNIIVTLIFIIFSLIYLVSIVLLREKVKVSIIIPILSLLTTIVCLLIKDIMILPTIIINVVTVILSKMKKNKKRLLFTAYNFEIGGIETALINLLNNINYDKYNVTVILEEKKGILLPKVNKLVSVKELKVSQNKNTIIRKITNLIRKLVFTIFNYQTYDFSCCYATYSYSGNKLANIASKNNVLYVHSNYKDLYKTEDEFKKFFETRNINKFRKIIFVSNESAADFKNVYPNLENKIAVFNNFIDVEKIKLLSEENIKDKKNKDTNLFVFVGRLDDSSKKLSRAINLVKEIKDITLWVVGDGPDKDKYKKLVKENKVEDRVVFFGKKENPYPYMREADYIILTSDYEGFPVTYLEAITLNKKIITTIDVSDESINIGKDFAHIISKQEDKMVKEVKTILKQSKRLKKIDIEEIQKKRIISLEKIFDEVI